MTAYQTCSSFRLCVQTVVVLSTLSLSSIAFGQAGLRESLERLDAAGDNDGRIDPEEITALARPYLEKIYRQRRLSMSRDVDIDKIQEASRIYHAMQNGVADNRVRSSREGRIRDFEPEDEQELIPEFGLAEVKYPYTQDDLEEADDTLRRYDRNDDGYIDRYEARRARWTHLDPFETDFNLDDRLSRLELGQRYARRRLLRDDSSQLIQRSRRVGNGIEPSRVDRRRDDDRNQWWRGGSRYWLPASMLSRFDANRNGRLEVQETKELNLPVAEIDTDRNGELSRDELNFYMTELQDEIGDDAEGLPGWFYELDEDGDGQVSMPEYTVQWTPEKLSEFTALDANADGLLTSMEVATSKALMGGSYSNEVAEVLPPKRTVISEIEIVDDVIIRDLDVEISITHSNTGDLDAFVTGPNGERVELFSDVGGSGNHFENTIFDEQAETPIVKARAPFEGRFHTEDKMRRKPGLTQFTGQNAKGVWQLVVRGTRSERFGMLHRWALRLRPEEQLRGDLLSAPPEEIVPSASDSEGGPQASANTDSAKTWSAAYDKTPVTTSKSSQWWQNAKAERPGKSEWKPEDVDRFRQWAQKQKQSGQPITAESKKNWLQSRSRESQGQQGDRRLQK